MSDQELLEREVEAMLARRATSAVPGSRRAPAPPWQEHRRAVDVRRFGRATPWLVAAVLLVIAGLGIGAAVTFDASGPDRRGPVATDPPSPSLTITAPDGTLGTTDPTPSTPPTLSRGGTAVAPDDSATTASTSGDDVVGIGTFGPVHAGMPMLDAMAATGVTEGAFGQGPGTCTSREVPKNGRPYTGMPEMYALNGVIIGIQAGAPATDRYGNGVGSTLAQLRASYPGGTLGQTGRGWTFTVLDGTGDGLGFNLTVAGSSPVDTDTVFTIFAGTAAYAQGQELCSG